MSFPNLARIAAVALLAVSGTTAAQTPADTTAVTAPTTTLAITFAGIEAKRGTIMLALFDEAGWTGGRPIRSAMLDASTAETRASIADLPAGRYGVKAFHDVNGNGRMDTNPFGMPTEPYAFSNDAKGQRGPASWVDAAFAVAPGANAQTITIR